MRVKLGEWEELFAGDLSIDTPVGTLSVEKRSHWHTKEPLWYSGLQLGMDSDGEYNWIIGPTDFPTADEAKAWIVAEYEKLVLSLIEVE